VTTVVAKLFNVIQPDAAYFGQKDAQQALVIRRMVRDLNFPVEIRVCPTVRGEGGLALSSRNQYLSESERTQATCLYQSFGQARRMLKDRVRDTAALIRAMTKHIESAGPCEIQYLRVVDLDTIKEVDAVDRPVLIALAVKIGPARLIDNIIVDSDGNEIIMADLK
jgi:pantoate--beta-alanine ligase